MCNNLETDYLDLLYHVLHHGEDRIDRTGVGTRAVFGTTIRHDLSKGFPLLTTKKMSFRSAVSELLWFIEGTSDERRLAEILHGSRDPSKTTIWTANAQAPYWKSKAQYPGDLGPVYGVQWRSWKKFTLSKEQGHESGDPRYKVSYIDQLTRVINTIKNNPSDRRMIISAWNVADLEDMALPPCHMFMQFFVQNNKLSCMMTQRSSDLFLGTPFNIASYALLTHMIAQVTSLDVGELIIHNGDSHIYLNHLDAVNEQLSRSPLPAPILRLNPQIMDITKFTMDDIQIVGYSSFGVIKAPMAV